MSNYIDVNHGTFWIDLEICICSLQNVQNIVPYVTMRQNVINVLKDSSWHWVGNVNVSASLNVMMILQNAMENNLLWKWMKYILIINSKYITNVIEGRPISLTKMSIKIVLRFITMQIWSKSQSLLFCISECAKHCSLCYNETECYECTQGFFLDENGECKRKFSTKFD